ncbi:hypothetical protein D3C72_2473160 [compost metagenome]
MQPVKPLSPLASTPEPGYGGAYYEFNRHGLAFQAGHGGQPSPERRHVPVEVRPREVVHVEDGVHGELDLYA